MEVDVIAKVDIHDVIDEINKYKFAHREPCLLEILNQIEWCSIKEAEFLSSEDKKQLYWWIKRKLEWIEEIYTPNQPLDSDGKSLCPVCGIDASTRWGKLRKEKGV